MDYWGNLTSLYDTVGETHVPKLEEAIRLQQCGLFVEAEQCLLMNFPDPASIPLVAITLADIHWNQGTEARSVEILDEAWLRYLPNQDDARGRSVKILLRLLHAYGVCRGHGIIFTAVHAIDDARAYFGGIEMEDITDVDVSSPESRS